jgi:hypothetical protein
MLDVLCLVERMTGVVLDQNYRNYRMMAILTSTGILRHVDNRGEEKHIPLRLSHTFIT